MILSAVPSFHDVKNIIVQSNLMNKIIFLSEKYDHEVKRKSATILFLNANQSQYPRRPIQSGTFAQIVEHSPKIVEQVQQTVTKVTKSMLFQLEQYSTLNCVSHRSKLRYRFLFRIAIYQNSDCGTMICFQHMFYI